MSCATARAAGDRTRVATTGRGRTQRSRGDRRHAAPDQPSGSPRGRFARSLTYYARRSVAGEPLDLGAIVRSAVDTSRPTVDAARHELIVDAG
jgi:hypothetical protein